MRLFIGLDISKEQFFASFLNSKLEQVLKPKQFKRNQSGIKKFLNYVKKTNLKPSQINIAMESSSTYWELLAFTFDEIGFKVYILNPSQVKNFARAKLKKAKTDKIDSNLIAEFLVKMKPKPWNRKNYEKTMALKQLSRFRIKLLKISSSLKNLNEANSQKFLPNPIVQKEISNLLNQLDETVKRIENEILKEIKSSDELYQNFKAISSIKGISKIASAVIIAETHNLSNFSKPQELVSFSGLAPGVFQSGKIKQNQKTTKKANKYLKSTLFLCALSAVRFNPKIKSFYTNLISKGKPKKVALIASARKLIIQCFYSVKKKSTQNEFLT